MVYSKKQNQTLTSILLKDKEDIPCDYEIAISRALCAKNALKTMVSSQHKERSKVQICQIS